MANPDVRRGTMKTVLAENLRELMKKKLFEKIAIKQICDETGVIRATFYNYFDDKYDCLNWIIHRDFFNNEELLYKGGPKEYFSAVLTVTAAPAKQPATPQHVHNWQPVYTTVHHDAQYQTVHHDAVTQDQWIVDQPSYGKVVCLGCGQQFNTVDEWGNHSDSFAAKGDYFSHSSYTVKSYPEKGHNETVVVTPAWDEQVQTSSPWDEQVVSGYQCSCGARK